MQNMLFLAYAHYSMFEDMTRSLGRGVMYAGAFRLMRGMSMGGAVVAMLLVLVVAFVVSRRA